MEHIKAYTDLVQSRKLAEMLPIETADMYYPNRIDIKYQGALPIEYKHGNPLLSQEIAAWSLAALLEQLEGRNFVKIEIKYDDGQYYIFYVDNWGSIDMKTKQYNNLIDACVEMIIKLKESNLL